MKYDIATPYTASYIILRRGNKVAFVLRSHTTWMNGFYSLPSGKVEKNETYTAAAIRETFEEVGVRVQRSDLEHVLTMHRHTDSKGQTIPGSISILKSRYGTVSPTMPSQTSTVHSTG